MKNLCKTLASIELVLGIIGSIFLSYSLGVRINYKNLTLERDGAVTIAIFASAFLCVITLWAILYAFSEVLENQDKILELLKNSNGTVAEKAVSICSPPPVSKKVLPSQPLTQSHNSSPKSDNVDNSSENWQNYGSWNCPNCKRVNDDSVAICMCGTTKPN